MSTDQPAAAGTLPAPSVPAPWRSLDEVKSEVMRRAGRLNPLEDIRREDAEQVVAALTSLDRDLWASLWSRIGLAYEATADGRASASAPGSELAALYALAFDYCRVGRYPVPSTPGKMESYRHSLRIFRKAAQHFTPALEIIELPFEGNMLTGYLQRPPGAARPPVVMHWGGVDGWKEDRLRASEFILRTGLASLTIDMPGAGENPVRYGDPAAERSYTAWLDHLAQRGDVDGSRVAVWGGSFGAYWAARLAYTQAQRIKGAVFHGGNVHYGFQEKWLIPAFTTGGATYLFGPASLLEARGRAMGTTTMAEFLAAVPKLSLVEMGLIDQPSAPILGINGKLDDQAPVEDIFLLMEHGSPKEARIYPRGHHMGRTPGMPEDENPEHNRGLAAGEAGAVGRDCRGRQYSSSVSCITHRPLPCGVACLELGQRLELYGCGRERHMSNVVGFAVAVAVAVMASAFWSIPGKVAPHDDAVATTVRILPHEIVSVHVRALLFK